MHPSSGRLLVGIVATILAALTIAPALSQPVDQSQLNGLEWRLVGPFRGGWGTMAAGVADQPDTFYFGAAGGGVWKTTRCRRHLAVDGQGTR